MEIVKHALAQHEVPLVPRIGICFFEDVSCVVAILECCAHSDLRVP